MSHRRLLSIAISVWISAVVIALGVRLVVPAQPFSFSESLVWLFAGIVPAAVLLSVIRGASSTPIAQVLYDLEHPADAKAGTRDVRR